MDRLRSLLAEFDRRGWFWVSGVTGTGIIAVASLITALFYHGRLGEAYSPANHFVSELGEVGVSSLAWLFNLGLLIGGFILVPFLAGLGRRIGGPLGLILGALGLACGVSGALVGAFPMNDLGPHAFWAMNFFNLGLLCMLLFSLIVLFARRGLPKVLAFPGLAATAAFASFLYLPVPWQASSGGSTPDVEQMLRAVRPPVMGIALFEWLAVSSVLAWALVVALVLRSADRARPVLGRAGSPAGPAPAPLPDHPGRHDL